MDQNKGNMSEKQELHKIKNKFRDYLYKINIDPVKPQDFDFFLVYPEINEISELLDQVDDLKKCLDSFRPLDQLHLKKLEKAWGIAYTYDSNRIEGNTLTLQETAIVIEKGITVKGKPLKDHIEAINHKDALDYIKEIVEAKTPFTEEILLTIHRIILQSIDRYHAGFYRQDRVHILGSHHICPNPLKVPDLMKNYFKFYQDNMNERHPVILAADMHYKLVNIHPFIDGNGRTARLIMNLILLQNGFPIANISSKERDKYYDTLELAHVQGDLSEFQRMIIIEVKKSLFEFLKMVSTPKEDDKGGYFYCKIAPYI